MNLLTIRVFLIIAFASAATASPAQLLPSDVETPIAQGPTTAIPEGYAGPSSSVAAVVDDNVVTTYDVEQRIKLMILTSGGNVTPEMLPQMQAQALRDLVQEKLKLLEAKEFDATVDEREIDGEIARIASQAGLTPEQLADALARDGVSITSMREQIRAGIIWPQLVQGRFRRRVRVSEDAVEQAYVRMREDATREQFLVSEICLPVADRTQARAYYEGALQLIEQMRKGVPFAVVAQQFSAGPSAAAGGDIGWVRAGELEPLIDEALRNLPPGAVTNPIPSEGAFMIMALRDKREAVAKGEESFTLAYAGASLDVGRAAARQALEKLQTIGACNAQGLRQDLGAGTGVTLLENVTIAELDERFRSAFEDLERNELSPIIEADGALHAAYVCDKDEGFGLPSRSALKDRLFSRQLTRISQQYLRDIERDKMIDIRLRQPGGPITAPPAGAPGAAPRGGR
ncbi:MAG: peptidylprolyl isomerase [Pseudomonadota bacterium]